MEESAVTWLYEIGLSPTRLIRVFLSLFIAILFIQSGLDKVFNWKEEKDFYHSHFSKSMLKDSISLLMPVLTIFELAAGLVSGIGIFILIITGNTLWGALGMILATISFCMLFFGQRLAKDYEGSAVLVPYFLVSIAGLYAYFMM